MKKIFFKATSGEAVLKTGATKMMMLAAAALLGTSAMAQTGGTCGDNLTWEYNTVTYTLTISGGCVKTHYHFF
jgi:hypothetical protein